MVQHYNKIFLKINIFLFLSIPLTLFSQSMQIDNLYKRFDQKLQELHGELIDFRRDLHRHPEFSGQEERTAGRDS